MKVPAIRVVAMWSVLFAAPILWGCSKPENANQPAAAVKDDHSGWWCPEHGIPEQICAQCDTSLVADFKKNWDWWGLVRKTQPARIPMLYLPPRA